MKNFTVLDTGKIDGGAYRWLKLADGSWRVEEWRGDKWVPGGASFAEIADAPPVSAGFASELGIPISDLGLITTTTPPTRPRLPTASEADLMSGEAFLEAFREANEEERAKAASTSNC